MLCKKQTELCCEEVKGVSREEGKNVSETRSSKTLERAIRACVGCVDRGHKIITASHPIKAPHPTYKYTITHFVAYGVSSRGDVVSAYSAFPITRKNLNTAGIGKANQSYNSPPIVTVPDKYWTHNKHGERKCSRFKLAFEDSRQVAWHSRSEPRNKRNDSIFERNNWQQSNTILITPYARSKMFAFDTLYTQQMVRVRPRSHTPPQQSVSHLEGVSTLGDLVPSDVLQHRLQPHGLHGRVQRLLSVLQLVHTILVHRNWVEGQESGRVRAALRFEQSDSDFGSVREENNSVAAELNILLLLLVLLSFMPSRMLLASRCGITVPKDNDDDNEITNIKDSSLRKRQQRQSGQQEKQNSQHNVTCNQRYRDNCKLKGKRHVTEIDVATTRVT